jgi:hypothetical protein
MIRIEFQTTEKNSNDILIGSITEVRSGGKIIGIVNGDYDGNSVINVCSRKIIDGIITLNVFGLKCLPYKNDYEIKNDSKLKIYLEYGETKYQTLDDKKIVLAQLNIPICDIELDNPNKIAFYKHCDGRIRKISEIPKDELYEWEEIITN